MKRIRSRLIFLFFKIRSKISFSSSFFVAREMDTSTILLSLTLTKVIVCPFHLYGRTVHTFILIVGPFIVIERITFPIVYNGWLDSLEKRVF